MAQKPITTFFKASKRKSLEEVTNESNKIMKRALSPEKDSKNEELKKTSESEEINKGEVSLSPPKKSQKTLSFTTIPKPEDSNLTKQISEQIAKTPILPSTIGHSWFKVLKKEFEKDYFSKVNIRWALSLSLSPYIF